MSIARWPWWRRWFGRRSERAAARFLRGLRYRIIAANYEDRFGEIDLIALDGRTLVIAEVRSTESSDLQRVLESVDQEKQKRLTQATLRFLRHRRLLGKLTVRFDVLAISWPADARKPRIEHFRDAFPAAGRPPF
jgi:putative endonuclease